MSVIGKKNFETVVLIHIGRPPPPYSPDVDKNTCFFNPSLTGFGTKTFIFKGIQWLTVKMYVKNGNT